MTSVVAGLACAATWAVASLMFSRLSQEVHPHALNLAKCALATPLLLLTSLLIGRGWPELSTGATLALLASSALGLAVADTAYISALKRVGTRAVLLVPLVPVMTTLIAVPALGEPLTLGSIVGMAVTLVGIGIVVRAGSPGVERKAFGVLGVLEGALYAIGQAGANVLVKSAVIEADPLHVTILRLSFGTAIILLLLPFFGGLRLLAPFARVRIGGTTAVATLIGTYGGIWLGSIALKSLPAGVATTLAATTPIWALAIARALGEPITQRALAGAAMAVVGVGVLVW